MKQLAANQFIWYIDLMGNRKKAYGAFEAKTKFSELLERVSKGESIEITRRDLPVARLVPINAIEEKDKAAILSEIYAFGNEHQLNKKNPKAITFKELIEDGRKW